MSAHGLETGFEIMRNFQTQMNLMRKHEAKYKPQYMLENSSEPDSAFSEEESPETKRPRRHSPVPASEPESDSD